VQAVSDGQHGAVRKGARDGRLDQGVSGRVHIAAQNQAEMLALQNITLALWPLLVAPSRLVETAQFNEALA
jgi:hypothetical protein